jgi:cytochrome P450
VWTSDPRHVKSILSTDFDGYAKGERQNNALRTVLGNGIFNADGDIWKFHRGITRPYFHRDRISDFALFAKHGDNAISQIKARMHEGFPVDFQDVMSRFTLDTATAFLLGSCVDSLSAGLPYPVSETDGSTTTNVRHHSDAFARAFSSAQHKMSARAWTGPSWQLFEIFGDATKSDNEIVDEFIGPILKGALAKKQNNEKSDIKLNPEEDTMLNSLLSQTDDYKLLRDETVNILIAARDTTASLLTSAIYSLSQHPQVAEKLRKEIIDKVGLARSPTYEDIKDMKYTRSVLNETLRLFPPV